MSSTVIRPVTPADLPGIVRLVELCGFPDRSASGWHWALFDNPAQGDFPAGWVCEHDGRLAGFLGNFVNRYRFAGSDVVIATGHTVVTDPALSRSLAGLKLIRHGISQPGVDAFVTLNNNALSAPLLKRVGAVAWLGQAGREWAEWILDPISVLRALVPARGENERFDAGASLRLEAQGRSDGFDFVPYDTPSQSELDGLDSAGALSRRITPQTLWHRLGDPDRAGGMVSVAAKRDGEVMAFATLAVTKPSETRPCHGEIVDLEGRDCTHGALAQGALLRHLVQMARRAGLGRLRLHFPSHLPEGVLKAAGFHLRRAHGHDPCHIHTRNRWLLNWRPRPGDADYFLAYRIPPSLFAHGSGGPDTASPQGIACTA